MNRGFIYLLSGAAYAELLCVSLWSLRRHSSHPATIFATDPQSIEAARQIASDARLGATVQPIDLVPVRRHASYVTKATLPRQSPYDRTVYLDADTLVVGPVDELFDAPMTATRFANWVTTGKIVGGRIRQWESVSPAAKALADAARSGPHPAINTGIFGFHRGYHGLPVWETLTQAGHRCSFTDELSLQILALSWPDCKILDDRFNCSPLFGDGRIDARIWHFHGRGHVRVKRGNSLGKSLWWEAFRAASAEKAGGIDQWAGRYDQAVKRELESAVA